MKKFFRKLLTGIKNSRAFAGIKKFFCKAFAKIKEFCRKKVVGLKRNPKIIPLLMLFLTFLFYSLNLTKVSNTTARIQGVGMGLCEFCVMLFSLLSLLCLNNAFPRRKKPNIPMIVVMLAMFAIIIYCDIHYLNCITNALTRAESPIVVDEKTKYILAAQDMFNVHLILMAISTLLVVTLPLYSKLIRKINTRVNIEDNGDLEAIEINE